jgi:hypothetical protein
MGDSLGRMLGLITVIINEPGRPAEGGVV